VTPSGIESATFRFVTQYLNHCATISGPPIEIYIYIYVKVDIQEVEWRGIDWIDLAQDRDRWRALVNAVMNLAFHKMRGIS
jgi:hypothetical protein